MLITQTVNDLRNDRDFFQINEENIQQWKYIKFEAVIA